MGKLTAIIILFSTFAWASVPVRQAASEKLNKYIDTGVFVGGHDHGLLDLINVRHSVQNRLERVVLDVGQPQTGENTERPGFFHIAVQAHPKRIVIDLQNVDKSRVTLQQISKLFQKSPYVSRVSMYQDRFHKDLTLELALKTQVEIEVFELVSENKPGRIVMDVRSL